MLSKKLEIAARLIRNHHFFYLLCHPSPGIIREEGQPQMVYAESAVDWLLRAHQVCGGQGFAKLYSIASGWMGPYVETTGYIIPTLYAFKERTSYRQPEVDGAIKASLKFLQSAQYPDGAFGDSVSFDPKVYRTNSRMTFDTGQVIFGLLAGFSHENDAALLESARRAGNWLCSIQEEDGSWAQHTYNNHPRTYYARVANALVALGQITGNEKFIEAARRQLQWVVRQQTPSGSFRNCSFLGDELTVLHVIAYTIDGVYRAGRALGEAGFLDSAILAAGNLVEIHRRDGILFGHYDPDWRPSDTARCLTGLAQMAEVWLLMYLDTKEEKFRDAAQETLAYLKRKQIINRSHPNIHGALMGSYPWTGKYFPWAIPNWSQKFFIDALLLEDHIRGQR